MAGSELYFVAAQQKWRFDSPQGELVTEQLFDLPLTSAKSNRASLNQVAKTVNMQLKALGDDEFVTTDESQEIADTRKTLEGKLELVKSVISFKQALKEAEKLKHEKRQLKQLIQQKIADRKVSELDELSLPDLEAKLSALDEL